MNSKNSELISERSKEQMPKIVWRFANKAISGALVVALAAQPCLPAGNLPVSMEELQKEMVRATQTREQNRATIANLLSAPEVETSLRAAHIDVQQVKTAISSLSDEDLAKLAARAQNAQNDLAAGTIGQRDLLLILIGIAVVILIIVAVR